MFSSEVWHIFQLKSVKMFKNKKVLLRERKRHTARCVASKHYAVAVGRGGTYPGGGGGTYSGGGVPALVRGVPTLVGGTYSGGGQYLPR